MERDLTTGQPRHELDTESLLRTIRFTSIALQQFWVEVQSFPLFLTATDVLKNSSIHDIEEILHWLQGSPSWGDQVPDAKFVPALGQAATRKHLLEFFRDVKNVRTICKELSTKLSEPLKLESVHSQIIEMIHRLEESLSIADKYSIKEINSIDLKQKIQGIEKDLRETQQIRNFFIQLSSISGTPSVQDASEAKEAFKAIQCMNQIPENVIIWRKKQILDPAQKIRLEAWRDRAKPIIELRKKIEDRFQVDSEVDVDRLYKLIAVFKAPGIFSSFKAEYKIAVEEYRKLIKPELSKKARKETPLEMIEHLTNWINYREQSETFSKNSDAQLFFSPHFKGIDTDFSSACEASQWAARIRSELFNSPEWASYIFEASSEKLALVTSFGRKEGDLYDAARVEELVDQISAQKDKLTKIAESYQLRIKDLKRLADNIQFIHIPERTRFSGLQEILDRSEEIGFLTYRMDSNQVLKAGIKEAYHGANTDLAPLEKAYFYAQYIDTALIPPALKAALLTVQGPQRFSDNRKMVAQCLPALSHAKEHLARLEIAIAARQDSFIFIGFREFLDKINYTLKNPGLVNDFITFCRGLPKRHGTA